jgi:serine/threonine-protein kinase HipA
VKQLEVRLRLDGSERRVGRLAEHERRILFEYDAGFVASGLELSPFKLPLGPGVLDRGSPELGGLPGLFHDSLPDGWGLLLMHRRMRERGIDPLRTSVLDWLRYLGERGMGALTYHPPDGPEAEPVEVALAALATAAEKLHRGEARKVLPELELAGGSPGGARPKVVVGIGAGGEMLSGASSLPDGFEHWLIKFSAKEDPSDMGPLEQAYAAMARAAGLDLPGTALFALPGRRRVFGAKRFDRRGNVRVHVHTAGGLLHASHRLPSLDYQQLLAATFALTRSRKEQLESFRRAAFNVLACNRDDHAHNFAFTMDARGEWRLAPAFDLTPSEGIRGHHTTSLLGESLRPSRARLLELARRTGLALAKAEEALRAVERAVDRFERFAADERVTKATTRRIRRRLDEVERDYARAAPHR